MDVPIPLLPENVDKFFERLFDPGEPAPLSTTGLITIDAFFGTQFPSELYAARPPWAFEDWLALPALPMLLTAFERLSKAKDTAPTVLEDLRTVVDRLVRRDANVFRARPKRRDLRRWLGFEYARLLHLGPHEFQEHRKAHRSHLANKCRDLVKRFSPDDGNRICTALDKRKKYAWRSLREIQLSDERQRESVLFAAIASYICSWRPAADQSEAAKAGDASKAPRSPSSGALAEIGEASYQIAIELGAEALHEDPVFFFGETGVGKELAAKSIHELSTRRNQPFEVVNLAGLTETIASSELFGHKKGAFTGAVEEHRGVVAAANNGTLFLDELAGTPEAIQVKLLRALSEGSVARVGSHAEKAVDIRLVVASNERPADLVRQGKLRRDLYYRLRAHLSIELPTFQERSRADISVIFAKLVNKQAVEICKHRGDDSLFPPHHLRRLETLSFKDFLWIKNLRWPGNVREFSYVVSEFMRQNTFTVNPDGEPRLHIHQLLNVRWVHEEHDEIRDRIEEWMEEVDESDERNDYIECDLLDQVDTMTHHLQQLEDAIHGREKLLPGELDTLVSGVHLCILEQGLNECDNIYADAADLLGLTEGNLRKREARLRAKLPQGNVQEVAAELKMRVRDGMSANQLKEHLGAVELAALEQALELEDGDEKSAARRLGITLGTFRRKLKALGAASTARI